MAVPASSMLLATVVYLIFADGRRWLGKRWVLLQVDTTGQRWTRVDNDPRDKSWEVLATDIYANREHILSWEELFPMLQVDNFRISYGRLPGLGGCQAASTHELPEQDNRSPPAKPTMSSHVSTNGASARNRIYHLLH